MRQLVCGVYAEGPRDQRYFPALLLRALTDICVSEGIEVEILQPIIIPKYSGAFVEQMQEIERNYEGLQLIFVHSDADGPSAESVLRHKWQPWMEQCREPDKWLPIIPVRMLESWLLADSEALARTFIISSNELERIIGRANLENVNDPKGVLKEIERVGKQRKPFGFEEVLAKRSRFSELARLSSFQEFTEDVRGWLRRFT